MRNVFQVDRSQSIEQVERELDKLAAQQDVDLRVPTRLKKNAIGGDAALIQLVVTWTRMNPNGALVTHIQPQHDSEPQLKHMIYKGYGFVAALLAKRVVGSNRETDYTREAYAIASRRVDEMAAGVEKSANGFRTLLAAADGTSKWKLPPLYFADGKVKDRTEFASVASQILAVRTRENPDWTRHISRSHVVQFGTILHELFRNTDDWAKQDASGVEYRRSVRGILSETREFKIDSLPSDRSPLHSYLARSELHRDSKVRFIEISVFDSGPGLAARWLQKRLEKTDISDEFAACIECLQKHNSSSEQTHTGVGLHEVFRLLSELRGFLRLRTGRLALFRDFVDVPMQDVEFGGTSELFDWESGTKEISQRSCVEGTVLTMLVPLAQEGA